MRQSGAEERRGTGAPVALEQAVWLAFFNASYAVGARALDLGLLDRYDVEVSRGEALKEEVDDDDDDDDDDG